MSNYIKSTDFASKDALLTGDPLKIVAGTEIDDEFNAIQTAINSKANTNSPTLTGVPLAPTASAGTNTTQIATTQFVTTASSTLESSLTVALQALYPVGSVYLNASDGTNPATLFGFGTWVAFGAGRVLVGLDSGNPLFDTAEETGGQADAVNVSHTHTASVTDPGHKHTFDGSNRLMSTYGGAEHLADFNGAEKTDSVTMDNATTGISVTNSTEGESGTNKNYQPYITVYMWKRTA